MESCVELVQFHFNLLYKQVEYLDISIFYIFTDHTLKMECLNHLDAAEAEIVSIKGQNSPPLAFICIKALTLEHSHQSKG